MTGKQIVYDVAVIIVVLAMLWILPMLLGKIVKTEQNYGPDAYRGCVASAYQADYHGVAGITLEDNLQHCNEL